MRADFGLETLSLHCYPAPPCPERIALEEETARLTEGA